MNLQIKVKALMKAIKIYQYKNCSTCKNAIKFLKSKHVPFTTVEITERPPSKSEIKKMIRLQDGEVKRLFNTSGQVYRQMALSEKLPKMTESQAIDLLAANGKLIKRPFVFMGDTGFVGFKQDVWAKALV